MEPYRVLLADDEEEIRVGISRKIDWAGLGFQAGSGRRRTGQEALERQLLRQLGLTAGGGAAAVTVTFGPQARELRRLPDPGLRPAAAGGLYLAGRGEPCSGGAAAGGSASGGAAAGCGCQIRGNA